MASVKAKVYNGQLFVKWFDGYSGAIIEKKIEQVKKAFPNRKIISISYFNMEITQIIIRGIEKMKLSDYQIAEKLRNTY